MLDCPPSNSCIWFDYEICSAGPRNFKWFIGLPSYLQSFHTYIHHSRAVGTHHLMKALALTTVENQAQSATRMYAFGMIIKAQFIACKTQTEQKAGKFELL